MVAASSESARRSVFKFGMACSEILMCERLLFVLDDVCCVGIRKQLLLLVDLVKPKDFLLVLIVLVVEKHKQQDR